MSPLRRLEDSDETFEYVNKEVLLIAYVYNMKMLFR
jgi:hypothetical protein